MANFGTILGLKIRHIRESHNMNQEQFAEKLNMDISKGQISRIETSVNMPSALFIKSVCETFNISPEWLLDINASTSPEEYELLKRFYKMPKNMQNNIKSIIEALSKD